MTKPHTTLLTAYDVANLNGEIDRMAETFLSGRLDDLVQQSIAYNIAFMTGCPFYGRLVGGPSIETKTVSQDDV